MEPSLVSDGLKFMWDGVEYEDEDQAKKREVEYREEGFETRTVEEEDRIYVFTRRVVKEVKVEGTPPI